MKQPNTILLLDIDGVFNVINPADPNEREERLEWKPGHRHLVWPIPMTNVLLQAIEADWRLWPIWCTCWWQRAWLWNDRSGTPHWPTAHEPARRHVDRWHPGLLPQGHYDWKLASALYYRRKYPTRKLVWLEDGFFKETEAWAASDPLVRLVDTRSGPAHDLLLATGNLEEAAQTFLSIFVRSWYDRKEQAG